MTGAVDLNETSSLVARHLRRSHLATAWLACIAVCFDLPSLAVAMWFGQYAATPLDDFRPLAAGALAALIALSTTVFLALTGGYAPEMLRRRGRSMALALAVPVTLFALAAIVLKHTDPGTELAWVAAALALVVVPTRIAGAAATSWIVETGLTDRRAVIAGGGDHARHLIRGLSQRPDSTIRLHGIFDDRDDTRSPIQLLGVPKIGGYDDLIAFARVAEIDMVIIALPLEAEKRINWLMDELKVLPVEVRLSAYNSDYSFASRENDPLIARVRQTFSPERRLTKRAFDLAIASAALTLLAPVMLLIAAAIRLDSPGPVFFRQRRHGFNDRIVEVLKFRSMYVENADPTGTKVVSREDPRVTRVGRFIRRTSIDELPQLFNVLSGDLSLVGPRPHAVDARASNEDRFAGIVKGYSARHRLPPGITGWAQINGWRGEIDDPEKLRARFEHDLFYIENWSVWLDLKILLRTPRSLLDTRCAY